jgi:hypothetical protein
VTWNRIVVVGVLVLAAVVVVDAVRQRGADEPRAAERGLLIDIASSRQGTGIPVATLRRAFPRPEPASLAVSKVATASDGVVAVGLSHVPGRERARAAIELWDGEELVHAFAVPVGSFSLGLWFADDGAAVATIGADGSGYLYDRDGRPLEGRAYFAYETP